MKLNLKIWRQKDAKTKGALVAYEVNDVTTHMSFLEMLDLLNEQLLAKGQEPVAFDHDCREGICGMCSLMVNGEPHGPDEGVTVCQLHMRRYKDGDSIVIEPWRSAAFPVLRDLIVDRGSFDRIQQAGGYVSVNTGGAPDANAVPIAKEQSDIAFRAATCIGCGACVAACPNASAMLFVAAKVGQLAHVPQGQPERKRRALNMIAQMDTEGFGSCTNHYECMAACPKGIDVQYIAEMNRDYIGASLSGD